MSWQVPENPAGDVTGRHPSVQQAARWFGSDHLPPGRPRDVSMACAGLRSVMLAMLPDDPELTAGLRKLLEAKDCFVRAAIASQESQ